VAIHVASLEFKSSGVKTVHPTKAMRCSWGGLDESRYRTDEHVAGLGGAS
jgi:hypothetical protein